MSHVRKGRKGPAEPDTDESTLDEALFRAWQAGDADARARIWEVLYARTYTVAVRFCQRVGGSSTAEDSATAGFLQALIELDPSGSRFSQRRNDTSTRGFQWQGEESFVRFVLNRVLLRCRDAIRAEWRWVDHAVVFQPGDDEADLLGLLVSTRVTPEEQVTRREGLRAFVQLLEVAEGLCQDAARGRDRLKLRDLILELRQYLRDCLVQAGRAERDRTADGRDWVELSLDELVDVVNVDFVDVTRTEMYRHLATHLGVANMNTVYTRMADVREMLYEWLRHSSARRLRETPGAK
jgi:hypothetical protein